ncbi:MAG: membrane protein insertase YidC [Bacteroidetes bacterium]|nr:membrane protein insertase YidC [Bacteroidota bacterium]
MKKNNIIAFSLIALIFIIFYWYNARTYKAQQQEQARLDSIARIEQQKWVEMRAEEETLQARPDSFSTSIPVSVYENDWLDQASRQEERFFILENELIKVQFSNKGAKPYSALIKKYQTYRGDDLILFDGPQNDLSLEFYANRQLSTANFYFSADAPQSNTGLQMRFYLDSLAYIEYVYTLPPDSYMLDLDIRFVGVQSLFSRNSTQIDLHWSMDIPRMEKGYANEKNYSTMAYKYPHNDKVENLGLRKAEASEHLRTKLEWVAFQQQFFSAILVADQSFSSGDLDFRFYLEDDPDQLLLHGNANLQLPFDLSALDPLAFHFYFGPNHYHTLKGYNRSFEGIVPMGGWLIGWINKGFIVPIFNFLSKFIKNYGLIILILTILIKIVLYYPNHKSYLSSAKMRVLKPEVDKINARYPKKEDAMKKQQETMALYKKTGVSMFGGCLPMLFQFPILFAMFRFFPTSFELRQQGFLWATDLSGYDSILNLPFSIPMYGDHVSLFALLMGISMYFYSKMNQAQMNTGGQQMPGMNGMMLYFMPIFMVVICNNFSSGLSYYYMLSNVITIGQTWIIRKFFVDDQKILAQLQAKANANQAPKPKSKFQQRLDEAYKIQQQRVQEQQKRKR